MVGEKKVLGQGSGERVTMRRFFVRFGVFLFVFGLIFSGCAGVSARGERASAEANVFDVLDHLIFSLMDELGIVGVSLAVIHNERLVYVKTYGYSDKELAIPVRITDLFRIASISKLITQMAILQLAAEGLLDFEDRVFGEGSILGLSFGEPGRYVSDITVRHLLEFSTGSTSALLHGVSVEGMARTDLSMPPGSHHVYCNTSYSTLGRIIEKLSGYSYEEYVRKYVLLPIGITNMAIFGNERKPGEVVHYTASGNPARRFIPGTHNPSDATGGWIASATDLARVFVRVSQTDTDFRLSQSAAAAAGLANLPPFGKSSWVFTGGMIGTRAVMHKLNSETAYVLLWNTSPEAEAAIILAKMENAILNISDWPSHCLFPTSPWACGRSESALKICEK